MFNTIFTNSGPAIYYCQGCGDLYINPTITPMGRSRDYLSPIAAMEQHQKMIKGIQEKIHRRSQSVEEERESYENYQRNLASQFSKVNLRCLEPKESVKGLDLPLSDLIKFSWNK